MNVILDNLSHYGAAYLASGTGYLIISSIIKHMPEKFPFTSITSMWTWFRESAQDVVNMRSGTSAAPKNPTVSTTTKIDEVKNEPSVEKRTS